MDVDPVICRQFMLRTLHAIAILILVAHSVSGIQNCIESRTDKAFTPCEGGCKIGFYGLYCDKSCSNNCYAACAQGTANCLTGCDASWFKSNCSRKCSEFCKDHICDIKSGECIHGCNDGYYGPTCDQKCSELCTGGVCDEFGGCPCKEGANDTACYVDCTSNCIDGECAMDSSGLPTCSRGCQAGRNGPFCQELCPKNCSKCDVTGVCLKEITDKSISKRGVSTCCGDGWTGNNCNIECPNCIYAKSCIPYCESGYYGDECHLDCPDKCAKGTNGKPGCKKDSGECHSGCVQGYFGFSCRNNCSLDCYGRRCFQRNGSCVDCQPLKYGPYCKDECGNCIDKQCGRNGSCRACEQGWFGLKCKFRCPDTCRTKNCRVDVRGNHVCVGECQNGYTGDDCSEKCPSGCPTSCLRKNGTCPDISDGTSKGSTTRSTTDRVIGTSKGSTTQSTTDRVIGTSKGSTTQSTTDRVIGPPNVPWIIGGIFITLVVVCCVILFLCWQKNQFPLLQTAKKVKSKNTNGMFRAKSMD